jgi:hypothetical protein
MDGVPEDTRLALYDRVLVGREHGDFIEAVARLDWEAAAAHADEHNLAALGYIIKYRYANLPRVPADHDVC